MTRFRIPALPLVPCDLGGVTSPLWASPPLRLWSFGFCSCLYNGFLAMTVRKSAPSLALIPGTEVGHFTKVLGYQCISQGSPKK